MGSNYFEKPKIGNEISGESSKCGEDGSSSRRIKKKSNNNSPSEKPKQPQRGLGVAQLEKLRLSNLNVHQEDLNSYSAAPHFSYSSASIASPSYALHYSNPIMGYSEIETSNNIRYTVDSHLNAAGARWNPGYNHFTEQNLTRQLLNLQGEDHQQMNENKHYHNYMGSTSHNRGPSDAQELDLELRLSL